MKYMSSEGTLGQTDSIDLGVMPIPLYDTTATHYTAYRTGMFLALPANTPDAAMTGEVLELLSYHGTAARSAFYTEMLGKTPEEAPEDHKILQMLSRHMTCDLWDDYIGLHGDFYGATLPMDINWNTRKSTYRHTFDSMIKKLEEN